MKKTPPSSTPPTVLRMPAGPKILFQQYARAMDGVPWAVGGEAAEEAGPSVESAGGLVASPASGTWHRTVIDLLRAERHLETKR